MTTYEECSFSWYVCSTPMAAWKHNVHTGSESVPRRASVGQFGVSEQDVRLPRQRPTFGFSAPACLSFLFIFFSLFFFLLFYIFCNTKMNAGHLYIAAWCLFLEKENVCFFMVRRPADDAKPGRSEEREERLVKQANKTNEVEGKYNKSHKK